MSWIFTGSVTLRLTAFINQNFCLFNFTFFYFLYWSSTDTLPLHDATHLSLHTLFAIKINSRKTDWTRKKQLSYLRISTLISKAPTITHDPEQPLHQLFTRLPPGARCRESKEFCFCSQKMFYFSLSYFILTVWIIVNYLLPHWQASAINAPLKTE